MILKTPNITTDGRLVMLSLDEGLTRTINIYGVQEVQGKLLWSFARLTGKSPTKKWLESEDGDEYCVKFNEDGLNGAFVKNGMLVMEDIEGDDIEIEFQEIKMHYLVSEELD